MSEMAAAAYLKTLREKRGATQEDLAQAIGVEKRQVQNWEAGRNTPGIANLARVMKYLQGSIELYAQLLLSIGATTDDGIELARQQIVEQQEAKTFTDHQVVEVSRRLERLRSRSPALARQFLDYGRFLEEYVREES
ncbi:MAG: helix-turn-helix transcriptional regulator [Chloroflexaceae bacterium]|nr:helix-turn-helix transcriptional regulator [Chloroflexaceae bacterium]